MVIIIDHDKVAQLQVTRCTGCFACNTFLSTSITEESKCMVVDQLISRFVKYCGGVSLRDGKSNSVGETLAERTSGDLDTRDLMCFWVTGGFAVDML